jgi:predicted RNase H-like nuclease
MPRVTDQRSPQLLVGVDGCRAGWVAVTAEIDRPQRLVSIEVFEHIAPILDRVRSGEFAMVALDMPMGLTASGPRRCDIETRARLGSRASSVFATPPRPLLHCTTHREAVELGRSIDGRGISIQAFNLLPKIAQVDRALGEPPDSILLERVVEAHPESAFAELAGHPLATRKRTHDGRQERLALLSSVFSHGADQLDQRHRGAAGDDVLDAAILVRTAHRVITGAAEILGQNDYDDRGIPMRVAI